MPSKRVTPWPAYPYHLGLYYTVEDMRNIERRAKHRHQTTDHEEKILKRHVKPMPRNVTAAMKRVKPAQGR